MCSAFISHAVGNPSPVSEYENTGTVFGPSSANHGDRSALCREVISITYAMTVDSNEKDLLFGKNRATVRIQYKTKARTMLKSLTR